MTTRKLTRPGLSDNEYMTVTCTPDETAVEFFETPDEAEDVARLNLLPSTTTYVGKVIKQGQHAVRGDASHIAILVTVDDKLRRVLRDRLGLLARPKRSEIAGALAQIIDERLRELECCDDDKTHPGSHAAVSPAERLLPERTGAPCGLSVDGGKCIKPAGHGGHTQDGGCTRHPHEVGK